MQRDATTQTAEAIVDPPVLLLPPPPPPPLVQLMAAPPPPPPPPLVTYFERPPPLTREIGCQMKPLRGLDKSVQWRGHEEPLVHRGVGTDPPPACYDMGLQTLGIASTNVFVQCDPPPRKVDTGCQLVAVKTAATGGAVAAPEREKGVAQAVQTERPVLFYHNASGASDRAREDPALDEPARKGSLPLGLARLLHTESHSNACRPACAVMTDSLLSANEGMQTDPPRLQATATQTGMAATAPVFAGTQTTNVVLMSTATQTPQTMTRAGGLVTDSRSLSRSFRQPE